MKREKIDWLPSLFLEEKRQPIDLLALHIALKLDLDLGAAQEAHLFPGQVPGRPDAHGPVDQKALVVVEDGLAEAESGAGCVDVIGRPGGEQCDLARLESRQSVLLVAERRYGQLGVWPQN